MTPLPGRRDPAAASTAARLHPITVVRLAGDAVEIRWSEAARGLALAVFRGDSPASIETAAPLARTAGSCRAAVSGLAPDTPHFFKLVAPDGSAVIVGERRPLVEGCPNLRDLGGYETVEGRHVRWGLVYRSSNLSRLTEKGIGQIQRLGIQRIYDFRTSAEALKLPSRFPASPAAATVALPIQHGEFEPTSVFDRIKRGDFDWISEEFMLQGYIESIERFPQVWQRLFHDLLEPGNRPLLFHCTGGKDRTGVAAALILLALGVPVATVVADYGLSDGYNAEVRQAIYDHLTPFGVDVARVAPYFTAPESRLRSLLTYLRDRYGTANDYLVRRAGVSRETIAGLREALLE
ncbi:MAG: tyrosine-protein phosphatase [Desulfobacterales bacterium]|jgi:protein-tyrosine phosphatase|nr:tyrosine-protein phosphatase [Desulfobacterales bacterium]